LKRGRSLGAAIDRHALKQAGFSIIFKNFEFFKIIFFNLKKIMFLQILGGQKHYFHLWGLVGTFSSIVKRIPDSNILHSGNAKLRFYYHP
jgi:hypothetical protein